MIYVFLALVIFVLLDFLRAFIAVDKATKHFMEQHKHKAAPPTTFGSGAPLHVAIMGDSTFDVRGDSKIAYGPAQVVIEFLAQRHTVHVHMMATAGALSADVISRQLPQLKKLPHVDLVIIYMGANDIFNFKNPLAVGKHYAELLDFTERRAIPTIASEIANYWLLSILPLAHRAWSYIAIPILNAGIRRAAIGRQYFTLTKTKTYHNQLHKNRFAKPYLIDGVHPNDNAALFLGHHLLQQAQQSPATAKILAK